MCIRDSGGAEGVPVTEATPTAPTESPAVGQALDILGLLARHTEPLPAARIASALGLPRSSTYRMLTTLTDRGFVSHLRESGRFALGAAAYELGWAYQRQAPLQRTAAPLLARLVDVTTHNAHLAVMHGRDVLYVVEERAAGRPRLVTDVGVRLPAELTASGLAMLAQLSPAQVGLGVGSITGGFLVGAAISARQARRLDVGVLLVAGRVVAVLRAALDKRANLAASLAWPS